LLQGLYDWHDPFELVLEFMKTAEMFFAKLKLKVIISVLSQQKKTQQLLGNR